MTTCTKCDRPHYARGLCRPHYDAAVRAGDIVVGSRGRRIGSSSLPSGVQHEIAVDLLEGEMSLSSIANSYGVSRDQVRTIRNYLERLNT